MSIVEEKEHRTTTIQDEITKETTFLPEITTVVTQEINQDILSYYLII